MYGNLFISHEARSRGRRTRASIISGELGRFRQSNWAIIRKSKD